MEIEQVRNATLKIHYNGKTFLVDPWLAKKWEFGSFADIPGQPYTTPDPVKMNIPMPLCNLPYDKEKVLEGVDYYIVTHIHPDHIDMALDGTVGADLDKNIPLFVQNEADKKVFEKSGFKDVRVLTETTLDGVTLIKTPARHGTVIPCGESMGVIFKADQEKTLYIAGDTVWYEGVQETILEYKPQVIDLNACAAETIENGRLIMGDEDVQCVAKTAPDATLLISHMDTVAHATITRRQMRGLLAGRGVDSYLMLDDGTSWKD